jgi:DNA transposition AAA+ family ATPase
MIGNGNGATAGITLPDGIRQQIAVLTESEEGEVTQAQVAAESGISRTALSQYLRGSYPGDSAAVEAKLERWLNARGEQQTLQELIPESPRFFATRSAGDMMKLLRIAQSLEDMALIAGVPGVGKSTSCREYQRLAPNVWIATMASHTTGVVPVLKEICDAVGGGKAPSANGLAREISRKIQGRQGLLVIDECHHISVPALDAIRSLHDATGVGVALVGAPLLSGKVERMFQLHSRIGLPLYLLNPLKEDVDALLDAWCIQDKAMRRELVKIAGDPGALRSVTKVLRLATSLARGATEALQLAHIREAAHLLTARTTDEAAA